MTLRRRPTAEEVEAAYPNHTPNGQHTPVRELLRRVSWKDLWEKEDEEEWLLYPLIPARRLIALFSAAKTGKSLLMLEIAAALATSREVLGHKSTRKHRVLYIDFENDLLGDIRPRLQDMGYGWEDLEPNLDYLSFPTIGHLDTPTGGLELMAAVEEYRPELVVIDTISRGVGGEENANDTWLNFYRHTGLKLKQAGVALVRLDHTGKDETKGQRGGSAKSGDVDAIWKLTNVIAGQRLRLECIAARFRIETKEVVILRHDDPLHHSLEDSSRGTDREARIAHLIELADRDALPDGDGRDKLMAWKKERGIKAGTDDLREVARRRKGRTDKTFRPDLHSSAMEIGEPDFSPDRPPDFSGNGSSGSERKNLTETPKSQEKSGGADLPDLTPSLYRRGQEVRSRSEQRSEPPAVVVESLTDSTVPSFDTCQTVSCGRQLMAPHSQQRGICESCYVHERNQRHE